jgi:hypothetical protein
MTADDSAEKVENEADEEESAVGEVLIPEFCVLRGLKRLADFFHCPVNMYVQAHQARHINHSREKSRASHEAGLGLSTCAPGTHHLEQVTTNPEATAKRKWAWNAGKKESRKSRNRAFA